MSEPYSTWMVFRLIHTVATNTLHNVVVKLWLAGNALGQFRRKAFTDKLQMAQAIQGAKLCLWKNTLITNHLGLVGPSGAIAVSQNILGTEKVKGPIEKKDVMTPNRNCATFSTDQSSAALPGSGAVSPSQ